MHVFSMETHGVSTFTVPSFTTLLFSSNTLLVLSPTLYPLQNASLTNSVTQDTTRCSSERPMGPDTGLPPVV